MDIAVVCFFILMAVSLIFIFIAAGTRAGTFVVVFVEGTETLLINIEQNEGEIFIIKSPNGINEILVEEGTVRMIDANCPDGHCMRMGAISGVFQTITCLPNRVIVEIRGGGSDDAVDVIAH
jgi:hypothetical protein